MPRQIRIQYENAIYHVMARGNRRRRIYTDDDDRRLFLKTLAELCDRTGFEIFAWVLMDNHYHLVFRTPDANLVDGMTWFQNTYTRRFNSRHKLWGRLFGDRYKSVLVENDDSVASTHFTGRGYLPTLIDYVHLNPARSRIIRASRDESIRDYPWSSLAQDYTLPPSKRAHWVHAKEGLDLLGFSDSARGRRLYIESLDLQVRGEQAARCGLVELDGQSLHSTLRRGWYWGSEAFKEKMLRTLKKASRRPESRNYRSGEQGSDRVLNQANELLARGLAHFDLSSEEELRDLKRGDLRRVAIAWALCKKTSQPQRWIATRTSLRNAANVSQQVRRFDQLPDKVLSCSERAWRSTFTKGHQ